MDMNELVGQIQVAFDNSMEKLKTELRQEMNQRSEEIRQEMKESNNQLKNELRQEIKEVREELKQEINQINYKLEYDLERKIDIIIDFTAIQQEQNEKNKTQFEYQDKRVEINELRILNHDMRIEKLEKSV